MLFFEGTSNILEDFYKMLANLFGAINWDIILFAGIAFEVLFAIFFLIKSRFSYEVRIVKKLLKINNWLNKNRNIDQSNLIEFNNMMKATPKHLRYYWHEYMLNRDKNPSYYMSTYNLVEKPLKSSSFRSNLKNFMLCTIITASLVFLCGILKLGTDEFSFSSIALITITPLLMFILYGILVMIMRAGQDSNIESLYQYVHYFGRFLDRAVTTMPEYVDFEVLFTPKEIKKGIPVLNEYLEKRARQEQEELEKARINAVEHETYDFSSTGINGSLILERAINESETFINIRTRLLSEIQQIEDEMESIKRTYENTEKDYQKKMQVSKENVERLRKQQEETTNRIENNYIKKQQADEIKKQEQLEKDHDSATLRFNQEIEALTAEITTRQKELEERRLYVENVMKAEYETFSTKLYKSMSSILDEENQDEKAELIEIKDQISDDLQQANQVIAEKDDEISQLRALLKENNIDYDQYIGYASQTLQKESKRNKKNKKSTGDDDKQAEPLQKTNKESVDMEKSSADSKLIPLEQIPEDQRKYGDDGGFYDPNGYYRYPNGTYFTPNSEYHDEFGGWYEADGVTYHAPENASSQESVATTQTNETKTANEEGYYGDDGNYYYPNGAYYTPDGRYFDEFGGWYEADRQTYHPPEESKKESEVVEELVDDKKQNENQQENVVNEDQSNVDEKTVRKFEDVPESEREYGEDGGFFDNEGYYYYPNGAYFTPDGRYFDEFGGWYEADGETYHPSENQPEQIEKSEEKANEKKNEITEETKKEIRKLKKDFNIKDEKLDNKLEVQKKQETKKSKKNTDDDKDGEKALSSKVLIEKDKTKKNDSKKQEQSKIKKRGRPKKQVDKTEKNQKETTKKSRGRPRKSVFVEDNKKNINDESPIENNGTAISNLFEQPTEKVTKENVKEKTSKATEKKGRGRPKKEVSKNEQENKKEKRGRGRPKKSISVTKKSKSEFDDLMTSSSAEIDEIDELNEKIADENKRLAKHKEQRDKQLTEALFQLSNDEDNDKK